MGTLGEVAVFPTWLGQGLCQLEGSRMDILCSLPGTGFKNSLGFARSPSGKQTPVQVPRRRKTLRQCLPSCSRPVAVCRQGQHCPLHATPTIQHLSSSGCVPRVLKQKARGHTGPLGGQGVGRPGWLGHSHLTVGIQRTNLACMLVDPAQLEKLRGFHALFHSPPNEYLAV